MSDITVDGMALAQGVVETIVSIAAADVEGIACVGSSPASGLRSLFSAKPSTQGIEVTSEEDGRVRVCVRVEVYYGYALPELADKLRTSIADALESQVGMQVSAVDVFIDGIQFSN